MLRSISLLYLIVSLYPALSQNTTISGRVIDKDTGTPVKFAHVYFPGTYCGTVTNADGEFSLIRTSNKLSSVIVSALPYYESTVDVSELSEHAISLKKRELSRDSRPTQTQICMILKSVVQKLPDNYHSQQLTVTSFHRESVFSFDNIIQMMEAVIRHNRSSGSAEVLDAIYCEDKLQKDSFWHSATGGFYSLGWSDLPGEITPFDKILLGLPLKENLQLCNYYVFSSPGLLREKNASIYVINFDQKDNIKGALLKGTMYIDSASHAVVKLNYAISPKGIQYIQPNRSATGIRIGKPPLQINLLRESGEMNFLKSGNRYFLASHISEAEFNASIDSVQQKSAHYLKLRSLKVTTAIDSVDTGRSQSQLKRSAAITHNYLRSHYETYDAANAEWGNQVSVKADTPTVTVIEKLREHNRVWDRKEGRKAKEVLLATTTFSAEALKQDVTYMRDMISSLHPGLKDRDKKNQFVRMLSNAEMHLQRSLSETEFFKYLTPIVESIHCGHTQLSYSRATDEYQRKFGKYFPLDVSVMGRRAFLTENVPDSIRGSEILKINNIFVSAILQNIRYKASTEGMSAPVKDYFVGKHFARLYAENYFQPDSFHLEIKDWRTKKVLKQTVAATNFRLQDEQGSKLIHEIDSLQTLILMLPQELDYEKMQAFLQTVFQGISKKQYTNLVIDLRDHEHFKDRCGAMLYSYLSSEAFNYVDRIEMPSADTTLLNRLYIGEKRLKEVMPSFASNISRSDTLNTYINDASLKHYAQNPSCFTGNVFILVNGGTSSEAADFAKFVQLKKRATVIGQETHSAFHRNCDAGETSIILPNSRIRVTFPLAKYKVSGHTSLEEALLPDYPVQYSITDIVEKRDKEMQLCVGLIMSSCCSAKSN